MLRKRDGIMLEYSALIVVGALAKLQERQEAVISRRTEKSMAMVPERQAAYTKYAVPRPYSTRSRYLCASLGGGTCDWIDLCLKNIVRMSISQCVVVRSIVEESYVGFHGRSERRLEVGASRFGCWGRWSPGIGRDGAN